MRATVWDFYVHLQDNLSSLETKVSTTLPSTSNTCGYSTHINCNLGPVGVLNGRVVALNPLIVHKLGCVTNIG
jgi:hypothetical protein